MRGNPSRRSWSRGPWWGALVFAGALALAGCTGGGTSAAEVRVPTVGVTVPTVEVTGTASLAQTRDGACSGDPLPRSGWECTTLRASGYSTVESSTDPRVDGHGEVVVNCDFTEVATAGDGWKVVGQCWGPDTLTNEGGTWEGTFTGTTVWSSDAPNHLHTMDMTYRGTGDYEGLQYAAHASGGDGGTWSVVGQVGSAGS